jgi:hypothetical protein
VTAEFGLFRTSLDVNLDLAPNPKPTSSDKRGFGQVASLYTAFSLDFARYALDVSMAAGHRTILDPFAGMGTLGEAARDRPVDLILNDLNPFAVTASWLRTAHVQDIASALGKFSRVQMGEIVGDDRKFFLDLTHQLLGDTSLAGILNTKEADPVARVMAHVLAVFRISLHKRLRGSNPTWTKRTRDIFLNASEVRSARESLCNALAQYTTRLCALDSDFSVDVRLGNALSLEIQPGSIGAIITSPPYPNRTDYIRHYLPAVEMLIAGDVEDERRLRETQIGTPLIRAVKPSTDLPNSVAEIVSRISNHHSYASERYYGKGYHYYFSDMQSVLHRFATWLAPKGVLVLVVQDAHYKEIRIPVGELFRDMAELAGLRLSSVREFPVKTSLAWLSPHSRAIPRKEPLFETALLFTS